MFCKGRGLCISGSSAARISAFFGPEVRTSTTVFRSTLLAMNLHPKHSSNITALIFYQGGVIETGNVLQIKMNFLPAS